MKPFFIDMRTIPIQIREETAFLIIRKTTGKNSTIKHSVSDYLWFDTDGENYEWYCEPGPAISLQDFLDNVGPVGVEL